jgi:anti-anti-sigma factor
MKNKSFIIKSSNNKSSNEQTLVFEGDLGIKNAVAIKNMVQSMKFSGNSVVLNLKNVEKLDITTIQTITALENSLNNQGHNTKVLLEIPEEIEKLLENSGFSKTL